MTKEQAKEFMWVENHKNPSVIKWQHHKTIRELVENLIDQIYNEHEAQLKAEQRTHSNFKELVWDYKQQKEIK